VRWGLADLWSLVGMVGFWWIYRVWVVSGVGFSEPMSFGVVESRGLMDWLWSLRMFGED